MFDYTRGMAGRADHSTQTKLPKKQYVEHLDERIGVLSAQIHALSAELATLDERMLRDIGLSRVDVDAMRRMW